MTAGYALMQTPDESPLFPKAQKNFLCVVPMMKTLADRRIWLGSEQIRGFFPSP
jgi:hypothetical protein